MDKFIVSLIVAAVALVTSPLWITAFVTWSLEPFMPWAWSTEARAAYLLFCGVFISIALNTFS